MIKRRFRHYTRKRGRAIGRWSAIVCALIVLHIAVTLTLSFCHRAESQNMLPILSYSPLAIGADSIALAHRYRRNRRRPVAVRGL